HPLVRPSLADLHQRLGRDVAGYLLLGGGETVAAVAAEVGARFIDVGADRADALKGVAVVRAELGIRPVVVPTDRTVHSAPARERGRNLTSGSRGDWRRKKRDPLALSARGSPVVGSGFRQGPDQERGHLLAAHRVVRAEPVVGRRV